MLRAAAAEQESEPNPTPDACCHAGTLTDRRQGPRPHPATGTGALSQPVPGHHVWTGQIGYQYITEPGPYLDEQV